MRIGQIVAVLALLIVVCAGQASADMPFMMKTDGHIDFEPAVPSELDEFVDSLFYHDWPDGGLWYYQGEGGLYTQVRFTATVEFEFRGFSFFCRNPANVSGTTLFLYEDNNGSPGQNVLIQYDTPEVIDLGNDVGYALFELDENQYHTFEGGSDFWVSFQVPNINQWMPYFDDQPTGERNWYGAQPNNPQFAVDGDWYVNAGGDILGEFYDIKSNYMANGDGLFHMLGGEELTFMGEFENLGTLESEQGQIVFEVEDPNGATIWSTTATLPPIPPGAAQIIPAPESWTAPDELGRYIGHASVVLPNDGDDENDEAMLMQQVVEIGTSWFSYDDGTNEGSVVYPVADGPGAVFYPPTYPASLDTVAWYLSEATGSITFKIYEIVPGGVNEVWSRTDAGQQGWNGYAPHPTPQLADGFWALMYILESDGQSIPQDTDPPVSAANAGMPYASAYWSDSQGDLFIDNTGNWLIRGKMSTPPLPDIVFPEVPFNMGDAVVDEPHTFTVPFSNEGDVDGMLEAFDSVPPVLEIPAMDDLPITIAPGEDYELEIIWTPPEEGDNITLGFFIEHNDINDDSPFLLGLYGTATDEAVGERTAEVPDEYFLDQNQPNPFNPETSIRFGLKAPGKAELAVYNVMGRQVATVIDRELRAGEHTVTFSAADLPSGVYFYSLRVNGYESMHKMVVMK